MEEKQCERDSDVKGQMLVSLTKDQYEQLLNLLGTLQVGSGSDNIDNMMSGAVNLASILACYLLLLK